MSRHAAGANLQGRSATAIVEWYWARVRIAKAGPR